MSRRDQIRMTTDEQVAFIAAHRTMTCATIGPNGRPHLMPLWYVPDGLRVSAWTYAASQKTRNLERLAQATLQFEDGTSYEELRGVMIEADVTIVRDVDEITAFGVAVSTRYAPPGVAVDDVGPLREMVAKQASKRVLLTFEPTRIVSWDHRKLGGTY